MFCKHLEAYSIYKLLEMKRLLSLVDPFLLSGQDGGDS